MKNLLSVIAILCTALPASAQKLTLDSCRAMALNNNKELAIGRVQKDVALNLRKSARTKYLPRITALGGYEWMSKEVSLLNSNQKTTLSNIGTTMGQGVAGNMTDIIASLEGVGIISHEQAQQIGAQMGALMQKYGLPIEQAGNAMGQDIVNALRTDTHNMWAGSVMLTQPLFMGGAIIAANKMADIQESMAANDLERRVHETLFSVDHTYWLIVSLQHKYQLAKNFNKLVVKLDNDVKKMIAEGVATKADGLKVAVKVNESEMTLTQAENGIALAKMLLCQQCGMPLDSNIELYDEFSDNLAVANDAPTIDVENAVNSRPETQLLENMVDMSRQTTKLMRATYLPQAALTGGYMVSNPNVFNGFEKKFAGVWNVGVMLRVPVWNWMDSAYKIRASKAATTIAELTLSETKEKMELQISQQRFKVKEANKHLTMAQQNIKSAEENLRCADLGFKEGVITSTDLIAAQTAWYMAQCQKVDAEIEVRMSNLSLKKALGAVN